MEGERESRNVRPIPDPFADAPLSLPPVWKELREAEEAEAELEGGASTLSILPEYMKKGRAGKASASAASMPTPPPPPPPLQIAPQIAIRREECASTGILEVLFRGFTPSGKILLWRSPRPAYDSADRKR